MKLEIEPKFEKAWYYANEHFNKISLERLEHIIENKASWQATWSGEELEFLVECWHVINTGKCSPANYVEQELEEEEIEETQENLEFYAELEKEKEEG